MNLQLARHEILGIPVDAVDMDAALEYVAMSVEVRTSPGFVLAVNPEKIYALRADDELKNFFSKASMLLPDGIGVVKALKHLYHVNVSRVPGADLMQKICEEAPRRGYKIFLLGSTEEVNKDTVEVLRKTCPGINIVGRHNGFITNSEKDALVEEINASGANILFVAMGSPMQELWMQVNHSRLTTVKICQGVGGTFDVITGRVKRAPLGWQRCNLEWLYRLLHQPTRAKRQLNLLRFIFEVAAQKMKMKSVPDGAANNKVKG